MVMQAAKIMDGDTVEFVAGATLNIGDVEFSGELAGVVLGNKTRPQDAGAPATTVTSGETGIIGVKGVYRVPKASSQAQTVGQPLYWDATNNLATIHGVGNVFMGVVAQAAGANDTTVLVDLNHRVGQSGRVIVCVPYDAASVDTWAFIADRAYTVKAIKHQHTVVVSATNAATLAVRKITADAVAPGATAGANCKELLGSALNLKATANTTVAGTLSSTAADLALAAGNKIGLDFTGTLTALAGGLLQIELEPR